MSGVFITFEGIEGSGKSTIVQQVAGRLRTQGRDVVVTREPGGTAIGEEVRHILLSPANESMAPLTELLLYAASRAQHVAEVIQPALAAGRWVLCDRYADATEAYQGAARRLPPATIKQLRAIATQGVEPQLTILLDLPVETGFARLTQRGATDRLERETAAFHERVRSGYLQLAKKIPERIKVIDTDRDVHIVLDEVMKLIQGIDSRSS